MATPFRLPSQRRLEFFNEATTLLWCHCMFIFTDFVPDPFWRYETGFLLVGLVGLNLGVNLAYLFWTQPRTVYNWLR